MGRALALILASIAPALQSAPPSTSATVKPADPGPRVAIAGLRSIDAASTVIYAGAEKVPHRLHAAYAFPDRARWWIGIGEENAPQRQMRFRLGSRLFAIDPGVAKSRALEGAEQAEVVVQLEMRRALLMWPNGFEWKFADGRAATALGTLGTLSARFENGETKRPTSLMFTRTDDRGGEKGGAEVGDEYRSITWREEKDRSWPAKFELWHEGRLVWNETIETIDTSTRFIDSYYLPPDRREASVGTPLEVGAVRALDLPATRARRIPLADGTTWDAARAEWSRLTAEQTALLKPARISLDDKATFEVSDSLKPTAILLRLGPASGTRDPAVLAQWPETSERPGLSTFVIGLPALKPELLISVRKAIPTDAHAGAPYVRFDPAHADQHVLVVLPLSLRDG